MERGAVPAETARELKSRIEAERRGADFLVYRGADDRQRIVDLTDVSERLTIGRSESADLSLAFDLEVSGVHAELERIGGDWIVVDDGLSRNGSFVNEERVVARRRLRDGDVLRFGGTMVLFRSPAQQGREETITATDRPDPTSVTETQRRVLVALCRPFAEGGDYASPPSNREIAEEVFLSIDAVKANLRVLFERFDVGDRPQNKKRVRLAELAMRSGMISLRDLER